MCVLLNTLAKLRFIDKTILNYFNHNRHAFFRGKMRRSVFNPPPAPTATQFRTTLMRPPKETCREKFCNFFWDKRRKTCMTRTPMNWLSIFIYYVIFLIAVFLICYISLALAIYLAGSKPHYVLNDSPIGGSPGLNYFPYEDGRPLIWLKKDNQRYVKLIKETLDKYKKDNPSFKEGDLGECARPPFGYNDRKPCIFFRLNRLFDWVPNPYINGNVLPKDVPNSVKNLIQNEPVPKVWLACEGATPRDRDHMSAESFKLQGPKGFDTSVFPFNGQKTFADPIVAVKINDSEANKMLYTFTCSAWSKAMDPKKTRMEITYYYE